ncbi:Bax inhibitor-1 family protein (plasmid) [Rossellomorea sp. AcN35-11]|nr:Bax inhibitor-1 family protein [Rossellomorea aquimaris]WJV32085.1 Bax inhibitor-1 family protein [Rossellomorea sp. AcN35-11]
MESAHYAKPYNLLFSVFLSALLVSLVGFYVGQFIPTVFFIPLIVLELVLLITMMFLRKKKALGYPIMYTFMFLSGITLYPAIAMYVSELGAELVGKAIGVTVFAFAGIAFYTMISKRDFRFLGGFLFVSLLVLIGLGIASVFFPFGNQMEYIYSGFGILIFVGYTFYDFSRLTHEGFTKEDIPMLVVSIYLDFVNLLLYVLRFLNISKD